MKKIFRWVVATSIVGFFFVIGQTSAQVEVPKIYSYDSIDTTIVVSPDSTFTVDEDQVFNYKSGAFHQGSRSIPLDKVSRITDTVVVDGATGQSLRYSAKRLDKTNPASWGSYTTYTQGGNLNIEWYYDLSNTKHLWELQYTVHGGFEFYKNNDRIYWNIFSDYDVPVGKASVRVEFPEGVDLSQFKFDAYRTAKQPIGKHTNPTNEIDFETSNVSPGEAFTIDIAFPKGIVREAAFWKEWAQTNYGYLGSAAVVLSGIVFLIAYWYRTERYKKGRGIVIAQYEPPQQLRPAMAEVLVKESITSKAWPATIVDLAVRGYVRVVEENAGVGAVIGQVIVLILAIVILGSLAYASAFTASQRAAALWGIALLLVGIGLEFSRKGSKVKGWLSPKSYCIEKVKDYEEDPALESYEKKFLAILFPGNNGRFSLKEIKKDRFAQRALAEKLNKLKQALYAETDNDTKAFANKMSKQKYFGYIILGLFIFWVIFLRVGLSEYVEQWQCLILVIISMAVLVVGFLRFEPRLSQEGYLLKEDWLGFKLYLETAERYRLQNLTPDIFEKYLPYAMIFGIEKKWAKTFEAMSMQPPTWYGSPVMGVSVGTSPGVGFSPVIFSSSFSSSFASAFASSGGGGGGGSAGGGGGGGGGGAS